MQPSFSPLHQGSIQPSHLTPMNNEHEENLSLTDLPPDYKDLEIPKPATTRTVMQNILGGSVFQKVKSGFQNFFGLNKSTETKPGLASALLFSVQVGTRTVHSEALEVIGSRPDEFVEILKEPILPTYEEAVGFKQGSAPPLDQKSNPESSTESSRTPDLSSPQTQEAAPSTKEEGLDPTLLHRNVEERGTLVGTPPPGEANSNATIVGTPPSQKPVKNEGTLVGTPPREEVDLNATLLPKKVDNGATLVGTPPREDPNATLVASDTSGMIRNEALRPESPIPQEGARLLSHVEKEKISVLLTVSDPDLTDSQHVKHVDDFIEKYKDSQDPIDRLLLCYLYVQAETRLENLIGLGKSNDENVPMLRDRAANLRSLGFDQVQLKGLISEDQAQEILSHIQDFQEGGSNYHQWLVMDDTLDLAVRGFKA